MWFAERLRRSCVPSLRRRLSWPIRSTKSIAGGPFFLRTASWSRITSTIALASCSRLLGMGVAPRISRWLLSRSSSTRSWSSSSSPQSGRSRAAAFGRDYPLADPANCCPRERRAILASVRCLARLRNGRCGLQRSFAQFRLSACRVNSDASPPGGLVGISIGNARTQTEIRSS